MKSLKDMTQMQGFIQEFPVSARDSKLLPCRTLIRSFQELCYNRILIANQIHCLILLWVYIPSAWQAQVVFKYKASLHTQKIISQSWLQACDIECESSSATTHNIPFEYPNSAYVVFVHMQEMRRDVGQLQSALIQKLSILDRYEHILLQINTVAMQKLVDPQTQVCHVNNNGSGNLRHIY